ncbi:MAG TPA: hypothetical protein VGJ00_09255 [Rhabdochlamydiaceae bacterium]|jgi:hypothetical protein
MSSFITATGTKPYITAPGIQGIGAAPSPQPSDTSRRETGTPFISLLALLNDEETETGAEPRSPVQTTARKTEEVFPSTLPDFFSETSSSSSSNIAFAPEDDTQPQEEFSFPDPVPFTFIDANGRRVTCDEDEEGSDNPQLFTNEKFTFSFPTAYPEDMGTETDYEGSPQRSFSSDNRDTFYSSSSSSSSRSSLKSLFDNCIGFTGTVQRHDDLNHSFSSSSSSASSSFRNSCFSMPSNLRVESYERNPRLEYEEEDIPPPPPLTNELEEEEILPPPPPWTSELEEEDTLPLPPLTWTTGPLHDGITDLDANINLLIDQVIAEHIALFDAGYSLSPPSAILKMLRALKEVPDVRLKKIFLKSILD